MILSAPTELFHSWPNNADIFASASWHSESNAVAVIYNVITELSRAIAMRMNLRWRNCSFGTLKLKSATWVTVMAK